MMKLNNDKLLNDAKLWELFEKLDDNVCDDYSLWEALTVDKLGPAGIRCVAEHLLVCPKCRKACADAYKIAGEEETPLYARIRRCKENPALETDKYFKIIAAAYDETIEFDRPGDVDAEIEPSSEQPAQVVGNAGKTVVGLDDLSGNASGCYTRNKEKTGASCALFASALSNGTLGNEEKPGSLHTLGVETLEGMSKENAGKTDSAWGRFCQNKRALGVACSVAAALAVVVVGVTLGPNASDAPDIDNPRQLDPELDSLRDFLNQLDATHHNASSNWDFEGSKSTTLGASKAMRAPTYDLCNLNVVTPQYNDAVDSFNDGDYRTAAKNFEKLVKKLKKNKSVDSETIDGAYWNWGVATLNAGDKTKAAKIFRNLEKRNLSPEMRRMTEDAREECQN